VTQTGKKIPLSKARQVTRDVLWACRNIPIIPVQRRMSLARVIEARDACADPPPWSAIFLKAYALLAQETNELRRAYLAFPFGRLIEYPESVAMVAVERIYAGEYIPFQLFLRNPAAMKLSAIGQRIRHAKSAPVEQVPEFRLAVRFGNLPTILRRVILWSCLNMRAFRPHLFGTFGLSTVASFGSELEFVIAPTATLLTYGPILDDGTVNVRVMFDHRITDGAPMARGLKRLEDLLNGPIADEVMSGARL
jgi:hypothetical protein